MESTAKKQMATTFSVYLSPHSSRLSSCWIPIDHFFSNLAIKKSQQHQRYRNDMGNYIYVHFKRHQVFFYLLFLFILIICKRLLFFFHFIFFCCRQAGFEDENKLENAQMHACKKDFRFSHMSRMYSISHVVKGASSCPLLMLKCIESKCEWARKSASKQQQVTLINARFVIRKCNVFSAIIVDVIHVSERERREKNATDDVISSPMA